MATKIPKGIKNQPKKVAIKNNPIYLSKVIIINNLQIFPDYQVSGIDH